MPAPELHTPESLLARIRRDGVRRTAQALRKPPLPSALLQALLDLGSSPAPLDPQATSQSMIDNASAAAARAFVAAYPLAPSHLLETLATDSPTPEVLAHLATNPRTPPHLLVAFAAHPEPAVRAQVSLHPQLPARELLALVDDPDDSVRRALAANASLRLPQQALLSADASPSVRVALAGQSALATPAALVLALDDSAVVRLHTVASAPADDDTLLGWAATDEEDVQLALLRRRTLPESAEQQLLLSSHPAVRRAARERAEPDAPALLHFATAGEPDERAWVAARPALPRALQRLLARDPEPAVRSALAANPSLDPAIAAYFVDLADEPACLSLAANPSVSDELIQGVAATRRPAVLAALAYRERLDPDLARVLVVHSPVFRRHWAVQDRPLSDLDAATAKTLATDRLPAVRSLAVRGHAWRRADLYDFVRDPVPRVRLAAVQHPNAPDELLSDALTDPAPEVANAARSAASARATARSIPFPTLSPQATSQSLIDKTSVTAPPSAAPVPSLASAPRPPADATPRPDNLLSKLSRLFR